MSRSSLSRSGRRSSEVE